MLLQMMLDSAQRRDPSIWQDWVHTPFNISECQTVFEMF